MKIFSLLIVCVGVLLSGCSQREPSALDHWMENNGKVKVLSTTAIIDDLVSQIGKERVDHLTLITGQLDPHSYELVKGDDEKLKRADLIFSNGLGLEHGASLRYSLEQHPRAVMLGDEIRKRSPQSILSVAGQVDPHIWMDLSLWSEAIPVIAHALGQIDPEGAAYFEKNAEVAFENIKRVDEAIRERLLQIPKEKRFLVTSHDAFNYFARRYLSGDGDIWQEHFKAPEGLSPEGQLSCMHLQQIIDHLILHQIKMVFPESNLSRDSLKKIVEACKEKGVCVKISEEVLYGDALGAALSGADSHLKMMEHNASILIREWGGAPHKN
jgi:manganese/zinc/iron transport system substrate-binding protein